jgi:diguanylate cyclase (GGDEF)-like protein/PAS domain S-box-containing protein
VIPLTKRRDIGSKLALALWGTALATFIVAGIGLAVLQSLTLEQRVRQILEPYAQLVAVGTDAAVAFEDPVRAQEILDTLRSNPHILDADLFLDDGRLLASLNRQSGATPRSLATAEDGVSVAGNTAELVQSLPRGARLRIRMGLQQLAAQTTQALWFFGAGVLALLAITFAQLTLLRRTIVRPIISLTETAERVKSHADYRQRIPVAGSDEIARLGGSFNAMMAAIQERETELRKLTDLQRTILDNAAHGIISATPDGVVTSFNPAAERLLGYSAAEVIGRMNPSQWHDPAELEERARQLSEELGEAITPSFEVFAALPRRNRAEEREWTYIRKDGRRIPVSLSITALRNDHGDVVGLVGLSYDLSERKQAEQALQRLNRELRAISDCNQTLVRAEVEQTLLDDICHIICEKAGYRMAWVAYADTANNQLVPVAHAGAELGYIMEAMTIWQNTEYVHPPQEIAVRTGSAAGINDFESDSGAAPWRDAALSRGYRSSISLPLKNGDQVFGVLAIYADEPNAFTSEERRMLGELSDDLAFGIVTLRTKAEHAKAEEQIQIAATAFEAQEGIMITDANLMILRVNRAFTDITGYSQEEAVGATPQLLASGHQDAAFYRAMWNRIGTEGSWQGEVWNRRKNGDLYPEWLNITAVKNARNEVTHYVGTMIDITERKEAERQIEHLAFYDLLTGLPNRRLFIDRLQQAMAGSARTQHMGAILFIDLDNFKIVNDTCGHDVGDRLLIEVARRLNGCVRDGDTISRLGGDEFIAMLEDLSEHPQEAAAQARTIAKKVIEALNQPYSIGGRMHHSTPSIGATLFSGNQDSVDELLKQADIAMYQAKSAGRNTLSFFDPEMQAAVAARASLEADLRQGIDEQQLVLHYQPQVDAGNCIIGAEALVRWQHPTRGMIPPAQFIPLAEETDLILPIGQWVLEEACACLSRWAKVPAACHLSLAVNVSVRQFRQPGFVAQVRQSIDRTGVAPNRLKLELTESLVIDDIEDTITKMVALKALGVGFSMDDFGTGYSSLSYLTRLPLDQVKIDQSFVRRLPDSPNDAVVVQSIITLAESLGITVIAEGVETEAQRQFLERHGCPLYQGYLFNKPVPLGFFEDLLPRKPA